MRKIHGRLLRSGDICRMDDGHKGRCASRTFYCDGCGNTRRGTPEVTTPDGPRGDGELEFCFMCVRVEA